MITYEKTPAGIIELTVAGDVTKADVTTTARRLAEEIEAAGAVRILENVVGFTGITPQALWEDLRLALPLARQVGKAAVVADQRWIRAAAGFARLFTSAEVRVFAPGEMEAARSWLASG